MEFEKHEDGSFTLEMSRRNLEVLLAKLDDPMSARTLTKVGKTGEFVVVKAVENDAHYKTRPPGEVYMPSSGQTL